MQFYSQPSKINKMNYISIIIFAFINIFFALDLCSQTMSQDTAQAARWQEAANKANYDENYTLAAQNEEKAAELYQKHSLPQSLECWYKVTAAYLKTAQTEAAAATVAKMRTAQARLGAKLDLFTAYLYFAEIEQNKIFRQLDEQLANLEKIETLYQSIALTGKNLEQKIKVCFWLAAYYEALKNYPKINQYTTEGQILRGQPLAKNSWEGLYLHLKYIYWQAQEQKSYAGGIKKLQELSPIIAQWKEQGYQLELHLREYAHTLAYRSGDKPSTKTTLNAHKEWTQKTKPPHSLMETFYYVQAAVVAKDMDKEGKTAIALNLKALETMKYSYSPRHQQLKIVLYRNMGFTQVDKAYNNLQPDSAAMWFREGLKLCFADSLLFIKNKPIPDLSSPDVICYALDEAGRLLQGYYQALLESSSRPYNMRQLDAMANICEARFQMTNRIYSYLKTEVELQIWDKRFTQISSDMAEINVWRYLQSPKSEYLEEVLYYSEQAKSAKMRRVVNKSKALELAQVDKKYVAELKTAEATARKSFVSYELAQQRQQKDKAVQGLKLYFEQQKIAEQLEIAIAKKYPRYQILSQQTERISIADIQTNMPRDAVFHLWFMFEGMDTELVILPDTVWIHKRDSSNDAIIDKWAAVSSLPQILPTTDSAYQAHKALFYYKYRQLCQKLIPHEPLLAKRGVKQMVNIPAVNYAFFPIELLLYQDIDSTVEYRDYPFLLKKYAVSYATSATDWLRNKQAAQQTVQNGKVLAFAPHYERGLKNTARSKELLAIRTNLSELAGAKAELANISAYYYGDFYQAGEANEGLFKQKSAAAYGILHFAMHGLVNEENPELSALAFAETVDTTEDNFLNSFEIANLQLNSQLVVLSACETAKGQIRGGEGLMSIARYFMYAGAPSVVATRWQVNDQTTAFIMQNFYKYIYEGKTTAEALSQAQLDYLAQAKGVSQHPFYWAAFTNFGYTQAPVYLAHKNWAIKYYVIGFLSIAVLCFGAWWYFRRYAVLR